MGANHEETVEHYNVFKQGRGGDAAQKRQDLEIILEGKDENVYGDSTTRQMTPMKDRDSVQFID